MRHHKRGCTEVFRMHAVVKDPRRQVIRYLDVNSLHPYVMANTDFPAGHPVVRRGDHSCHHLLKDLEKHGISFLGLSLVRVLAPRGLTMPYLPHKIGGKLMFFCAECAH